ncbi:MAG: hypothetical protein PHY22_03480 [Acholeplasmataceae bacterium]|nr:hypothetical protein [Acholeplasmataceae bacterium]
MTLVVTAIALGTTTYAWFTIGERVAVEDIKMQVKAGEGLEIAYMPTSVDTANDSSLSYVKTLQSEYIYEMLVKDYFPEIESVGGTGQPEPWQDAWTENFEMDAVTSTDGKEFKKIVEGTTAPYDYSLGSNVVTKEDGFVEFKLAFRTLSTEKLDLIWDHVSLTSEGEDWTPEKTYTPSVTNDKFYAANAARISINSGESTTVVFENADDEQGIRNTVLNTSNFLPNKGAHQYFKLMTGQTVIDPTDTTSQTTTIMSHDYETVETITSLSKQKVATFHGGTAGDYQYVTITVRIYIEGMDPEAFNSILGDTLTVQLGFLIDLEPEIEDDPIEP